MAKNDKYRDIGIICEHSLNRQKDDTTKIQDEI